MQTLSPTLAVTTELFEMSDRQAEIERLKDRIRQLANERDTWKVEAERRTLECNGLKVILTVIREQAQRGIDE